MRGISKICLMAVATVSLCFSGLGVASAQESNDQAKDLNDSSFVLTDEDTQNLVKAGIDPQSPEFQNIFNEEVEKLNELDSVLPLSVRFSSKARGDGCSYSPDRWGKANFKPGCDRHDICYSSKSKVNRADCDKRFKNDLLGICVRTYKGNKIKRSACGAIAITYYKAVRAAGWKFYKGKGKNN